MLSRNKEVHTSSNHTSVSLLAMHKRQVLNTYHLFTNLQAGGGRRLALSTAAPISPRSSSAPSAKGAEKFNPFLRFVTEDLGDPSGMGHPTGSAAILFCCICVVALSSSMAGVGSAAPEETPKFISSNVAHGGNLTHFEPSA
jgi:hypothetical protein